MYRFFYRGTRPTLSLGEKIEIPLAASFYIATMALYGVNFIHIYNTRKPRIELDDLTAPARHIEDKHLEARIFSIQSPF